MSSVWGFIASTEKTEKSARKWFEAPIFGPEVLHLKWGLPKKGPSKRARQADFPDFSGRLVWLWGDLFEVQNLGDQTLKCSLRWLPGWQFYRLFGPNV